MKFEVYCDESRPDLLSTQNPQARFMVIGGLWLPAGLRERFKSEIHVLRDQYRIGGEFKWQKVTPSRLDFYRELIDWFTSKRENLRFRCIAVDRDKVDLFRFHEADQELGFYKFYYQMLHQWILDFNEYSIFCDYKSNRVRTRLHELESYLDCANLSSVIGRVQAVRSPESVLLQTVDVLTGIAAAKLNDQLRPQGAKMALVNHLEKQLDRPIGATYRSEHKFNVFVIDLAGGW